MKLLLPFVLSVLVPVLSCFAMDNNVHEHHHHGADEAQEMGPAMPGQPMQNDMATGGNAAHGAHAGHSMVNDSQGNSVMVMRGIPLWLFVGGAAAIILVSFLIVVWLDPKGTRTGFRRNLIKNKKVYAFVKKRSFQAIPQLLMMGVLVFLIYAGLAGSQQNNIAPLAVWTVWWAGLIYAVALVGPLFCFMCPWDGFANLFSRLNMFVRGTSASLNLSFPRWLGNVYPAIVLFVGLTWLELGYGVTTSPKVTAYMGLGMTMMAVAAALVWEDKKFCTHMCPVGRISGIYANFSPVELRARNLKACAKCETEDCLHGNELGYACPTGISLKTIPDASECIFCTECIKSCRKNNVAFNVRPFAADLSSTMRIPMDMAWLALVLLTLTLFHGFSMTTAWENFVPGSNSVLKWTQLQLGTPKVVNFTIWMLVFLLVPVFLYWVSNAMAQRLAPLQGQDSSKDAVRVLFTRYAVSLLPIALFYHLAHNSMHLMAEGMQVIPALGDPLGRGVNYWGLTDFVPPALPESVIWNIQVLLVIVGHIVGVVVAHRVARSLYTTRKEAMWSLIPLTVLMIGISVFGLWLMYVDMNMRSGRM